MLQFFSGTVADCMEELMNRDHPDFILCNSTIQFIRKINMMADIMNSKTEMHSLGSNTNSSANKVMKYKKIYHNLGITIINKIYVIIYFT